VDGPLGSRYGEHRVVQKDLTAEYQTEHQKLNAVSQDYRDLISKWSV